MCSSHACVRIARVFACLFVLLTARCEQSVCPGRQLRREGQSETQLVLLVPLVAVGQLHAMQVVPLQVVGQVPEVPVGCAGRVLVVDPLVGPKRVVVHQTEDKLEVLRTVPATPKGLRSGQ